MNSTASLYLSNTSDDGCFSSFFWDDTARENRKARLITCIIGSVIHTIFWSQLAFCSSVRQASMQWIYAYLVTDILLFSRFFFTYIAHTLPSVCTPNSVWLAIVCYTEIIIDNYLNVLEVYILLALNICRYIQIKHNRNAYRIYKKNIVLTHVGIYIIPVIYLLIQFVFQWTTIDGYGTGLCQVIYTNLYIQICNIIFTFALPIALNLFVIYASVKHVRSASGLQAGQYHVSARQKYHRSLVLQFAIFYAIWLALWSPNVIAFQLSVTSTDVTAILRLINFIEIAIDPLIISALDVRFWHAWKSVYRSARTKILGPVTLHGRIQPSTIDPTIFTMKTSRLKTTINT